MNNEMSPNEWWQNWARLIQKVYEVDPLICPKCQGEMRIVPFIEDECGHQKDTEIPPMAGWETRDHDSPAQNNTHTPALTCNANYSQIPAIDYWLQ